MLELDLIREGLSILKGMGGKGVVLVGDPGYYRPLGFGNDPELVYEGDSPGVCHGYGTGG